MVVHNFHFISVSVPPHEAEAPLIVDTNAVLALAVPMQFFQAISRNARQLVKIRGSVQGLQLAEGLTLDRPEPPYGFPIKKALRIGASEGPNHNPTI
jgi:hypothetical protein